jgi:hypothetical protein
MTIIIMTTVGGIRKTYIWHILTKATTDKAGPSNIYTIAVERVLSKIPRSFENLLIRVPEGVLSKKWPGLRTIPLIICL